MSRDTNLTWAYYIAGRNILLYEVIYGGTESDINKRIRIPAYQENVKLK